MKVDSTISAVVTGAASGLGEAVVRQLRNEGVKVAVFDMNSERGEAIARELNGTFCQVDVCSTDSVTRGFAKARAVNGQERILVNCAGIALGAKTVSRAKDRDGVREFPLELFDKVVQVNLVGTFRCIVKAASGMMSLDRQPNGERGVIINTASIAAQDGQMGQAAYSASKAGIVGMSLPIARDMAAEGIRINTILPGIMKTPMMAAMPSEVQDNLAASVPYPSRLGDPTEFASLALELIRNSYLNAAEVRLDGALRMAAR